MLPFMKRAPARMPPAICNSSRAASRWRTSSITSATSSWSTPSVSSVAPPKSKRRFEGFADLEVDAGTDQPECGAAVVGARQHRHQGKLGLHQLGYPDGGLGLVDADQHGPRAAGAGSMQYVQPRAVAIIDLETEIGGRLDHLDIIVDDRDVDAAQQQRLAGDLAEAAEADDQHAAGQAIGDVDAFERLLVLRRQ